jgi:hypothetical protein
MPAQGKLKDTEKDEIRAKFLAAKAARQAKKAAAGASADATAANASTKAMSMAAGDSDDGLDV